MNIGEWALQKCRSRKRFWGKLIRGCDADGAKDTIYLERHFLVKVPKRNGDTLFGVFLHNFLRSDTDRAPHDHPWWFFTVVLSGGYWENQPNGRFWRGPGSCMLRKATHIHWVELPKNEDDSEQPAITLFTVGPQVREWGFWLKDGRWLDWVSTFKMWGC